MAQDDTFPGLVNKKFPPPEGTPAATLVNELENFLSENLDLSAYNHAKHYIGDHVPQETIRN